MHKKINYSFEVFPPTDPAEMDTVLEKCIDLNRLNPEYFSITYGAGGVNQAKTVNLVEKLVNNNLKVVPHISCINTRKNELHKLLTKYKGLGIRQLVTVRGDLNKDSNYADFYYANELVSYIQQEFDDYFHITVAAHPEFHPESVSAITDLQHFKSKVESGAKSAITQFFFNSDAYFNFLQNCKQNNINIPIIPGIMPIHNYQKIVRFAKECGAEIPLWLRRRLGDKIDDPQFIQQFSLEVVIELCKKLIQGGVNHFHFYTLNNSVTVGKIINSLGISNGVGEVRNNAIGA